MQRFYLSPLITERLSNLHRMKKLFTLFCLGLAMQSFALDPNHFTITRITAPYFIVDGNSPTAITSAYVGFEVKNNSNSATTYSSLKFAISSIGTSVVGQNYTVVSPASGIINVGTLAPGESKVCYYYVTYPANTTPQATFNITLSDNTASSKTQSFVIRNRSSISANAGGTATQSFTNQDLIGGTIIDDVTYVVGNVQNGDESDFQVAVSPQFDPTKISLLSTLVTASAVPGIPVGATDSLYFVTGNGSNGASVTVRWIFRITGTNFTNYLLPCAGSTSGGSNYKYALNTSLGQGSPVTVSAAANPLTITKTSDKTLYGISTISVFTITISNPGIYGVTIDKVTDQLPAGFTYQSLDGTSQATVANSTTVPSAGATGAITFEGGVTSGANTSYFVPAGGTFIIKYLATTAPATASNLLTTAKDYVGTTEVGTANNTVNVSGTLPLDLLSFRAAWQNTVARLDWKVANEINVQQMNVERSVVNGTYNTIGTVMAGGISDYHFIDSFPSVDQNKYRLKIIDHDGRYTYSPVLLLTGKQTGTRLLAAYPNPSRDLVNLAILSDKGGVLQWKLHDLNGTVVLSGEQLLYKGSNLLQLKQFGQLPAGQYLLQLLGDDGFAALQKITRIK